MRARFLNEVKKIIFPEYFGNENSAYVSLESFVGNTFVTESFPKNTKVSTNTSKLRY